MAKVAEEEKKVVKKSKKSLVLKGLYALIIVALIGFGAYYFIQYNKVNDKYTELAKTEDQRKKEIVNKVAKLYNIPKFETEQPTVIVVKDINKLEDSPATKKFFTDAKNDDIVLAYQKADLSIIFRPSDNKIIRTDSYANFLAASTPIRMAIIAPETSQQTLSDSIIQKVSNAQIVSKAVPTVAVPAPVVVDVSGKEPDATKRLADLLGYTVGQLPEGQAKPEGVTFVVMIP